ncbi:MAG: Na+/H+ antiporter [Candidatus Obscuribacterales bacterium]|jgi:CPA1 family monovalent cation:H+ antiporter
MQQVELVVALLAIIAIVGAISQKLRIALPIMLVLTGMAISMAPNIPPVHLEPDAVFFIFLPPLLYLDAYNTSWRQLKDVGELVTIQAVGLVLATVAGVALAIHTVVPGIPWTAALAFGAIVSPTDAVAASAIAKEVRLPKRLMEIIKGESLTNDATGLVAYQFAVAAVATGAFSLYEMGTKFFYVAIGGIIIGLATGFILVRLRTRLEHKPVEIIVSLLSPFIAYLTAEHLHVSSVLSVVTAGLLLGWRSPMMHGSTTRLHATANWETIAYLLNGFSFLLMGLQLRPILETVKAYPAPQLVLWTLTAALAPLLIRFAWTFTVGPAYNVLRKQKQPGWKHLFVFSWSGMRGVVSLAAALALPLTCSNGQAFPYRDLLIFLTIAVIVSTLILQGITLPSIVKMFEFEPDAYNSEEAERKARLALSREAVRRIDELARSENIDVEDPILQKHLNKYLERAVANMGPESPNQPAVLLWQRIKGETITAQRTLLLKLRDDNEIQDETFRIIQNELDLEETKLDGPT